MTDSQLEFPLCEFSKDGKVERLAFQISMARSTVMVKIGGEVPMSPIDQWFHETPSCGVTRAKSSDAERLQFFCVLAWCGGRGHGWPVADGGHLWQVQLGIIKDLI